MRDVEIQDLVLRIPGISEADARWIGQRIAKLLAASVVGWRDVALPSLSNIRVQVSAGAGREQIARAVSTAVVRSLQ